jgi:hypothetical protein
MSSEFPFLSAIYHFLAKSGYVGAAEALLKDAKLNETELKLYDTLDLEDIFASYTSTKRSVSEISKGKHDISQDEAPPVKKPPAAVSWSDPTSLSNAGPKSIVVIFSYFFAFH